MEGQAFGYAGLQQRMQYDAQRANTVVPTPVNPSCFGNIEDVRSMAVGVAQRVESIVERLAGIAPPSPEAGGNPSKTSSGLLDEADDNARSIRVSLQRIVTAVDRLEKALP